MTHEAPGDAKSPLSAQQLGALRKRDLNALLILSAVLRTGSVSGAARLLAMTQPAVSRALDRLRHELRDPLVVRQGNGVIATSLARQITPCLDTLLDQAQQVYLACEFDVANAQRDMRVAINAHLQQVLMPPLIDRIAREAPGIRLLARPIHEGGDVQNLRDGHLDLMVGMLSDHEPLRQRHLMDQRLVCLAHPALAAKIAADGPMSLEAFRRHPQIDVQPAGLGRISAGLDALAAPGRPARNVVCVLSSFDALLKTLEGGSHIGVVPELAFDAPAHPGLCAVATDFDLPVYRVHAWWHNVAHHDPAIAWLVGHLAAICAQRAQPPALASVPAGSARQRADRRVPRGR